MFAHQEACRAVALERERQVEGEEGDFRLGLRARDGGVSSGGGGGGGGGVVRGFYRCSFYIYNDGGGGGDGCRG